ncbi:MAG: [FeFe] hydrogenase H-cluster maturation GTPase HydF [Bacillota bacterium]
MSDLNSTPGSSRLQIAIFGRRNAGKSSLINALTRQPVALVSDQPGTTTDPVVKAMELLPLGPVAFIDTAGLDDQGPLGELRVKRTYEVLNRTDLAVVVLDGESGLTDFEQELVQRIRAQKIPVVGVINKVDSPGYLPQRRQEWQRRLQMNLVEVSANTGTGIEELKAGIIRQAPPDGQEPPLIGDLFDPGDIILLVVPIDKAAPKGRLILPQQQAIRDILDHNGIAVVAKEDEVRATLKNLAKKPALAVTDSQVFSQVAVDIPQDIPLTSFSILLARYKGDLPELVKGVGAVGRLKPGDRILIMEGCTHHRQTDDIGTVKIPRWLQQAVGGELQFEWASGQNIPAGLNRFRLIIHCGACMLTGREMLYRLSLAKEESVSMVNYGVLIAYISGILPRALAPFPEVREFLPEEYRHNYV